MSIFLEPVYLNEKMVLNAAAYLFKGVSLESESIEEKTSENKGNLKLGVQFLNNLISPISADAEQNKTSKEEIKTARRYTLGGLHMVVLDELQKQQSLVKVQSFTELAETQNPYVELRATLRPIDFYALIEAVETAAPLIAMGLKDFGAKINPNFFNKQVVNEIPKYEKLIMTILKGFKDDYMKSKQLEMVICDPENPNIQFGVVDIDVIDNDPSEIKGRLNDGTFHIIGKISRRVQNDEYLSLVQRTFLSTAIDAIAKAVSLQEDRQKVLDFNDFLSIAGGNVEKVCQLRIQGPAYRMVAMSVCV